MNFDKSQDLLNRAAKVIPDHTQTASKAPRRLIGPGTISPAYIDKADGCYITDVDGNRFLDMTMALCPILLGYNDPTVNEAVHRQVAKGSLFTLPGALEVEVAEELVEYWLPESDWMVRFLKTGSEATTAAVRLARAVTMKNRVITMKGHYHGWADWTLRRVEPALGVDSDIAVAEIGYGDLESLEYVLAPNASTWKPPAAVIMEPIGLEEPPSGYLQDVRGLCNQYGALLIFDETITGLRFNPTAADRFGVTPDLMVLGKAIANGYPLAVLSGKPEYMQHLNQDEVFVSGTYAGDLVSLAAAKATLQKLRGTTDIPRQRINQLQTFGESLKTLVSQSMSVLSNKALAKVRGYSTRFVLEFTEPIHRDFFQQECMKEGILFTGAHNVCVAHMGRDVITTIASVYPKLADDLAHSGMDFIKSQLKAKPTRPAFRRQG